VTHNGITVQDVDAVIVAARGVLAETAGTPVGVPAMAGAPARVRG
jgi:hypothetical protein